MYSLISGQPTSASEAMNPAAPRGRVASTSMIARSSCGTAVTPAAPMLTTRANRPPYQPLVTPSDRPIPRRATADTTTTERLSHAPVRTRDH